MSARDDEFVEVRMLVPRSELVQAAPAPELVSQANVLDTFGVPPRRFLEIVRSPRFPGRVLRNGHLRLVRRADFLAALERMDGEVTEPEAPTEPAKLAPLAERLGFEEAPRASRRRVG